MGGKTTKLLAWLLGPTSNISGYEGLLGVYWEDGWTGNSVTIFPGAGDGRARVFASFNLSILYIPLFFSRFSRNTGQIWVARILKQRTTKSNHRHLSALLALPKTRSTKSSGHHAESFVSQP